MLKYITLHYLNDLIIKHLYFSRNQSFTRLTTLQMEGNKFYVTLPSDSSKSFFENNTLPSFSTKLAKPLSFNSKWVVGLSELSYPYGFDTLESEVITPENNQLTANVVVTKVGRVVFPASDYSSFEDLYTTIRNALSDHSKQEILLNEFNYYILRDQMDIEKLKKNIIIELV